MKPKPGTREWWRARTRVDAETGCVLYTGFTMPTGHAQISYMGHRVLIHRLAYEQHHGSIPPGMVVCHTCDRPSCVNPDHLFAGTQRDNLRDMFSKGRARPQGKATAPLASFPAQTYVAPCRVRRSGTRKNSNTVREVVGTLHLKRTSADSAGDSHVLSGPSRDSDGITSRRSTARETWTRPDLRTPPAEGVSDVAAD